MTQYGSCFGRFLLEEIVNKAFRSSYFKLSARALSSNENVTVLWLYFWHLSLRSFSTKLMLNFKLFLKKNIKPCDFHERWVLSSSKLNPKGLWHKPWMIVKVLYSRKRLSVKSKDADARLVKPIAHVHIHQPLLFMCNQIVLIAEVVIVVFVVFAERYSSQPRKVV